MCALVRSSWAAMQRRRMQLWSADGGVVAAALRNTKGSKETDKEAYKELKRPNSHWHTCGRAAVACPRLPQGEAWPRLPQGAAWPQPPGLAGRQHMPQTMERAPWRAREGAARSPVRHMCRGTVQPTRQSCAVRAAARLCRLPRGGRLQTALHPSSADKIPLFTAITSFMFGRGTRPPMEKKMPSIMSSSDNTTSCASRLAGGCGTGSWRASPT